MQKSQSVIYVFEDENNHEKPCDNDCHKPITPPGVVYPWVQECPPPKPIELCETSLTPLWIQSNSQDAVVRVYTQTALTSATTIGRTLPIYSGVEGQDATSSYDVYSTFGNGFIAGGQIACPAHLVLLPPNLQIYNTYPITANNANAIANGNTVIPASLITVDVFNVNGCKSSFTYQAIILSVDGANDLAILAILTNNGVGPCSQMNVGLPPLENCHPSLRFDCSRQYRDTAEAYVLGDLTTSPQTSSLNQNHTQSFSSRGIVSCTVQDYKHVDYTGFAQMEQVLITGNVYSASGAPILNRYGKVIGMQTLATPGINNNGNNGLQDGAVGGPSSFTMIQSITLLDFAMKGGALSQVTKISAGAYNFLLLGHAYLGIAWDLVTGTTFSNYSDPVTGVATPRFTNGPTIKQIAGYRVRALAGDYAPTTVAFPVSQNVQYLAAPGVIPASAPLNNELPTNFASSPLVGVVSSNDIILEINGLVIGDLDGQASLSLALWGSNPGDPVNLIVRSNTTDSNAYNVVSTVSVALGLMPNWVNYPWYKFFDLPTGTLFGASGPVILPQLAINSIPDGTATVFAPYFPSV
jgi:hypothetical protein